MSDEFSARSRDPQYLTRRAQQARAAAEASTDPSARLAHQTMADRYAEELRVIATIRAD